MTPFRKLTLAATAFLAVGLAAAPTAAAEPYGHGAYSNHHDRHDRYEHGYDRHDRHHAYRKGYRHGAWDTYHDAYGPRLHDITPRHAYTRGYRHGFHDGYAHAPKPYHYRGPTTVYVTPKRPYHGSHTIYHPGHPYRIGGHYAYHDRTVIIHNHGRHGLYAPPHGYHWVHDPGRSDAILASVATGAIIGLAIAALDD